MNINFLWGKTTFVIHFHSVECLGKAFIQLECIDFSIFQWKYELFFFISVKSNSENNEQINVTSKQKQHSMLLTAFYLSMNIFQEKLIEKNPRNWKCFCSFDCSHFLRKTIEKVVHVEMHISSSLLEKIFLDSIVGWKNKFLFSFLCVFFFLFWQCDISVVVLILYAEYSGCKNVLGKMVKHIWKWCVQSNGNGPKKKKNNKAFYFFVSSL